MRIDKITFPGCAPAYEFFDDDIDVFAAPSRSCFRIGLKDVNGRGTTMNEEQVEFARNAELSNDAVMDDSLFKNILVQRLKDNGFSLEDA